MWRNIYKIQIYIYSFYKIQLRKGWVNHEDGDLFGKGCQVYDHVKFFTGFPDMPLKYALVVTVQDIPTSNANLVAAASGSVTIVAAGLYSTK